MVAAIFSSIPCKGNKAITLPSPNTPKSGIVQTGQPDAIAPVKALHVLEVAPFLNPRLPVVFFLNITSELFSAVKTAIANPNVTVETVNVIPYIPMYCGNGVNEKVRYQNNKPSEIEIMIASTA